MAAASLPLPDERGTAGVARPAVRHRGRFPVETVQHLIADSYHGLTSGAHVRTHLVVLTERFAAEQLDALAHAEDPALGGGRPRVLFVCSHNAGRSPMAAALLAHRTGPAVTASSAGTHPSEAVDPYVLQVLTEAGVALDEVYPEPLTDDVVRACDIVITMGCGDACPRNPGHPYLEWLVSDPEGAPIAVVRAIRDDLDVRITCLLDTRPSSP